MDVCRDGWQKRYIVNMRMGLESGQRIPLPALSLSFDTFGERTEKKSQNRQGKVLLMIAFSLCTSQHNCIRWSLTCFFRGCAGYLPFAPPSHTPTYLCSTWCPGGLPIWALSGDLKNTERGHSGASYFGSPSPSKYIFAVCSCKWENVKVNITCPKVPLYILEETSILGNSAVSTRTPLWKAALMEPSFPWKPDSGAGRWVLEH